MSGRPRETKALSLSLSLSLRHLSLLSLSLSLPRQTPTNRMFLRSVCGTANVPLRSPATIVGRATPGVVASPYMSREHARFRQTDDGTWTLQALGANPVAYETDDGTRLSLDKSQPPAVVSAERHIWLLANEAHAYRLCAAASGELGQPARALDGDPTGEAAERRGCKRRAASADGGEAIGPAAHDARGSSCGDGGGDDTGAAAGSDFGELPPYDPPTGPFAFEGMRALEVLATNPSRHPDRVFTETEHFVVAYDIYPKARVHLLIMPREKIGGPKQLNKSHVPLLSSMDKLASHISQGLRHKMPGLAPLRSGFHSLPSMHHLHLHVISFDHDSPCLKTKKHWNSFTHEDFFVPPSQWLRDLTHEGAVALESDASYEAMLKSPMRCPILREDISNIPHLKKHLMSDAYQAKLRDMR